MTNQEFFDAVTKHLLKQGAQSLATLELPDGDTGELYTEHRCMYRGDNGTKCAIGCLITDDQYIPEMENQPVTILVKAFELPQFGDISINLMRDMQGVHDNSAVPEWSRQFAKVAKRYSLTNTTL